MNNDNINISADPEGSVDFPLLKTKFRTSQVMGNEWLNWDAGQQKGVNYYKAVSWI